MLGGKQVGPHCLEDPAEDRLQTSESLSVCGPKWSHVSLADLLCQSGASDATAGQAPSQRAEPEHVTGEQGAAEPVQGDGVVFASSESREGPHVAADASADPAGDGSGLEPSQSERPTEDARAAWATEPLGGWVTRNLPPIRTKQPVINRSPPVRAQNNRHAAACQVSLWKFVFGSLLSSHVRYVEVPSLELPSPWHLAPTCLIHVRVQMYIVAPPLHELQDINYRGLRRSVACLDCRDPKGQKSSPTRWLAACTGCTPCVRA